MIKYALTAFLFLSALHPYAASAQGIFAVFLCTSSPLAGQSMDCVKLSQAFESRAVCDNQLRQTYGQQPDVVIKDRWGIGQKWTCLEHHADWR
jgi:hypothetical protein